VTPLPDATGFWTSETDELIMVFADRIDIMLARLVDVTPVLAARGRGTATPVMLMGGSAAGSSATTGSKGVGSIRDSLRAKLMKLDGRDSVLGVRVGVAETVGAGFGVMEKAANILSMTLPTFSVPGGRDDRDRRDRLFSCFSLRRASSLLLTLSSLFLALASSLFLFLSRRFSCLVVVSLHGLGGRSSCGTKPDGYETILIECGRQRRGSINGPGNPRSGCRRGS
jgi:hypothetical protein